MVENPEEVGLSSMRQVAREAAVKPATMTRLTKALGIGDYESLRDPFRQRLRQRSPDFAAKLIDVQRRGKSGDRSILDDLRTQELANVEESLCDSNLPIIEAAANAMHHSRRVYVLGLRGAHAPAFLFHYAYHLIQDNCQLLDTHAGVFADQLRNIGPKDSLLVISFPPYTRLTMGAVEYAAQAGAKIIAVTDSIEFPVKSKSSHVIITTSHTPSFYHSFSGALVVTQALLTLLAAKAGDEAVKIAEEAEKQLSRISAYW